MHKDYHLGISFGTHDCSATLLHGSEIVAFCEEEKLSQVKRTRAFPIESISSVMMIANIDIDDLATISLPVNLSKYKQNIEIVESNNASNMFHQKKLIRENYFNLTSMQIKKRLTIARQNRINIQYFDHHLSHAACAFFQSGFQESTVLVIDGVGELDTISIYTAREGKLKRIAGQKYPHSLGRLYGSVCRYLGFWSASKEGTVMALASHGAPVYAEELSKLIKWNKGLPYLDQSFFDFGITSLHPSIVSQKFISAFGTSRVSGEEVLERHQNIAASIQLVLERTILKLADTAVKLGENSKLCYAGGVAMNCKVNSLLKDSKFISKVFIPTACDDSGLSIGAAYLAKQKLDIPEVSQIQIPSPYLGVEYSNSEIISASKLYKVKLTKIPNPSTLAAKFLSQGEAIGWFQGRVEMGARALGNRSILASPNDVKVVSYINKDLKSRFDFQPFAPSVLKEYSSAIFMGAAHPQYMQYTFKINPSWVNRVPAIIANDNTARVHTVCKFENAPFHNLISAFYELTGLPLVLNTSMNGNGMPISAKPTDALNFFCSSSLNYLFLGSYLVEKRMDSLPF